MAALSLILAVMPALTSPARAIGPNPNQTVNTAITPTDMAQSLVGPGVVVSNVTYTGGPASTGSFAFTDPTVVGFSTGVMMSSGNAVDVIGPNTMDDVSGSLSLAGDTDLTALSGFDTFDAAVLEFDFVPTANQVVFQYAFGSEEYPEWVGSPFNDVFAFFVNGVNCAEVREVAGDPASPFIPVAVNRINDGGTAFTWPPSRSDLFRPNYFNPAGPSLIDLELDGITTVLTCQSAVNPGQTNHMKLAIADASDTILDSAVFIQAGSLVSNENPVADLSLSTEQGSAPLSLTAYIEGEDPNGLPLTYSLNWGDGTAPATGSLPNQTAQETHTYANPGHFTATLTVSNGSLTGTSTEDVTVSGTSGQAPQVSLQPQAQSVHAGDSFTFSASATGDPAPDAQWQVSTDGGANFTDIPGATETSFTGTATLDLDGNQYRAVFTNNLGEDTTDPATLTVAPLDSTGPELNPTFSPAGTSFLRNAAVTVSANASDPESGIASESCGTVDTTSVGDKSVLCSATNGVGLTSTVTVNYTVGFALSNASPADNTTVPRKASLAVSFTLSDANGVLSDAESASLSSGVKVAWDSTSAVQAKWNKKSHTFTASLRINRPPTGSPHTVTVTVTSGSFVALTSVLHVTIA
jgi:PKD repeat protein